MKLSFLTLALLINTIVFSQEQCLSYKVIQDQIDNAIDPQTVIEELEALKDMEFIPTSSGNLIKIPIVFHIIHNGDLEGENENLSDSIILEQLKRINLDFRGKNFDTANIPTEFKPFLADVGIEFCLAKKDTLGNFTTGIIHHDLGQTGWNENDINNIAKIKTIWDRNNYLNVWIFNFEGNLATNNVNGYATPPFTSTNFKKDGIVLNHTKVGNDLSDDIGRTLVHEIGHWLGLFHIWGDSGNNGNGNCSGDDGIDDTPKQSDPYQNCPSGIPISCGTNDMYINYMDYTDADCSMMFTIDQKNKMLSVLNGFRLSLLTATACTVPKDLIITEIVYPNGNICQTLIQPTLKIKNIGTDTIFDFGFKFYLDNVLAGEALNDQTIPYLAPNQTTHLKASVINTGNTSHSAKFVLNDIPLEYNLNNECICLFNTVNTGKGLANLLHTFEDISSFPNNFSYIENPDQDTTWSLFYTNTNNCIIINNDSTKIGKIDNFISSDYYLNFLDDNVSLSFDYLYKVNQNFSDTLTAYYSLDCGAHWVPFWQKQGLALSNNETANYPFLYSNQHFQTAEVYLSPILNHSIEIDKIRFKFENRSGGGNNLYLDNIQFKHYLAIEETNFSTIKVFPNPTKNLLTISQERDTNLEIQIVNLSGELLLKSNIYAKQETISIKEFPKGIYFLKISDAKGFYVQKILKN